MSVPTCFLYFGSESDSEARVCLRNMPVSPKTWILVPSALSCDLKSCLLAMEGACPAHQGASGIFGRRHIRMFTRLGEVRRAAEGRCVDTLLIYGWHWQDLIAQSQELENLMLEWRAKDIELHLYLKTENRQESERLASLLLTNCPAENYLHFWIPTQERDLLLCRLPSENLRAAVGSLPGQADVRPSRFESWR